MADFPQNMATLSSKKRELFERLLKEKGIQVQSAQPIARREDHSPCILSSAQQRLWFLDQLEPGNHSYHIFRAIKLSGPLNIQALQNALDTIVERHESLRTTIRSEDGVPKQVISRSFSVEVPIIDLSVYPKAEQNEEVERLLYSGVQKPFNLSSDMMLRATLLRLDEEEHILLLVTHHIATDGWSMEILSRELSVLYTAFSLDKPSPLPDLPIQYADFAIWQREWLQGRELEEKLSYWKQQLDGAPSILELPTDRPRPPIRTYQGAKQALAFSHSLKKDLKELSQRSGTTLFMTLLSAFATLLFRYSGQEDLVIGSPIANRNRRELEDLIGVFFNTLALRIDLSGNPTFLELLDRVRQVTMDAYDRQDIPFEKLIEELQVQRDLSRNPLVQILFALQNVPTSTVKLGELTLSPFDFDSGIARLDLEIFLWEDEENICGSILYDTDLFDAETITRLIGHFQTLLEAVVLNPQQHISELPLLTEHEQQQLLVKWNSTQAEFNRKMLLHQMFERIAERIPNAIAVVCGDQRLTYQELNSRANQLAHYLQTLGVTAGVLVGICVERSVEMIVGLLGILKAGGAYVPFDPTYPQQRLAFMLSDSNVPVLLTQRRLLSLLPGEERQVVCLDTDWEIISQRSTKNLSNATFADSLAYVIYTSGSTGRPKGVQIQHKSIINLLEAIRPLFHFDERDIWTVFHSYAFDFSVWEIWGALTAGSRLVIVPAKITQSPREFYELLCSEKVTVLHQTPSAIQSLTAIKRTEINMPLYLRLIVCGGEALSSHFVPKLLEWDIPIWNFYGPTEATVWTTITKVTSDDTAKAFIPIGHPIANTQTYILDRYLHPVPVCIPGELHISGIGLARGYFNRPELTAEKFIPNPFVKDQSGARLYKTGDLVRYLPNGDIEFLGRIDHQVKIRGFRIELGEVEAVLRQHSIVQQAVAIVREDQPGDKRLVAYVVSRRDAAPSMNELRDFLQQRLPEYMVPSVFMFLEQLPLTPNNKIDRRELPVPTISRTELESSFVPPHTHTESVIAEIWQELLNVDKISVYDNFFDLGGHSLLVMQVIAELEKKLKVRLNPGDFIYQTLGQVASTCEEAPQPLSEPESENFAQKLWGTFKGVISRKI